MSRINAVMGDVLSVKISSTEMKEIRSMNDVVKTSPLYKEFQPVDGRRGNGCRPTGKYPPNRNEMVGKGPQVNASLVGIFPTVGQTIENRHGKPIEVTSDINGKEYARPISGPLAVLKNGLNTIMWSFQGHE